MYRRRHLGDEPKKQLVEWDKQKLSKKSHGSFHGLDSDGSNLNLTLQSLYICQGGGYVYDLYDFRAEKNWAAES